jgi:hypothetical protein
MAVALEIRDGNPWYLSTDVWTVPGPDPEGAPGIPVVGQPCFLWARVRNTGQDAVQNATVRFYWANPAVGFDRTTANAVGTAYVTLGGGGQSDVLCLTPWVPVFVNGGHECILAEAFHPSLDPLPASPAFDVPTDRHVAQRNLGVALAARARFQFAFEIHNPGRMARTFTVTLKPGDPEELRPLVPNLGKGFKLPRRQGRLEHLGFVPGACPPQEVVDGDVQPDAKVEIGPGGRGGLSLVGRLERGGAVVHVLQQAEGRTVGGLAVLVLAEGD